MSRDPTAYTVDSISPLNLAGKVTSRDQYTNLVSPMPLFFLEIGVTSPMHPSFPLHVVGKWIKIKLLVHSPTRWFFVLQTILNYPILNTALHELWDFGGKKVAANFERLHISRSFQLPWPVTAQVRWSGADAYRPRKQRCTWQEVSDLYVVRCKLAELALKGALGRFFQQPQLYFLNPRRFRYAI